MWINVFLMKREREKKKEKSDFKYTETDAPHPPSPQKKIGEGAPFPIFSEGRRRLYIGQLFLVDLQ